MMLYSPKVGEQEIEASNIRDTVAGLRVISERRLSIKTYEGDDELSYVTRNVIRINQLLSTQVTDSGDWEAIMHFLSGTWPEDSDWDMVVRNFQDILIGVVRKDESFREGLLELLRDIMATYGQNGFGWIEGTFLEQFLDIFASAELVNLLMPEEEFASRLESLRDNVQQYVVQDKSFPILNRVHDIYSQIFTFIAIRLTNDELQTLMLFLAGVHPVDGEWADIEKAVAVILNEVYTRLSNIHVHAAGVITNITREIYNTYGVSRNGGLIGHNFLVLCSNLLLTSWEGILLLLSEYDRREDIFPVDFDTNKFLTAGMARDHELPAEIRYRDYDFGYLVLLLFAVLKGGDAAITERALQVLKQANGLDGQELLDDVFLHFDREFMFHHFPVISINLHVLLERLQNKDWGDFVNAIEGIIIGSGRGGMRVGLSLGNSLRPRERTVGAERLGEVGIKHLTNARLEFQRATGLAAGVVGKMGEPEAFQVGEELLIKPEQIAKLSNKWMYYLHAAILRTLEYFNYYVNDQESKAKLSLAIVHFSVMNLDYAIEEIRGIRGWEKVADSIGQAVTIFKKLYDSYNELRTYIADCQPTPSSHTTPQSPR